LRDDRDQVALVEVRVDDGGRIGRLDVHRYVVFSAGLDDAGHLLLGHAGRAADLDGVGARRRDVLERLPFNQRLVRVDLHDVVPVRPVAHVDV